MTLRHLVRFDSWHLETLKLGHFVLTFRQMTLDFFQTEAKITRSSNRDFICVLIWSSSEETTTLRHFNVFVPELNCVMPQWPEISLSFMDNLDTCARKPTAVLLRNSPGSIVQVIRVSRIWNPDNDLFRALWLCLVSFRCFFAVSVLYASFGRFRSLMSDFYCLQNKW